MGEFPKSFEFERSYTDPTLYIKHGDGLFVLQLVRVDDTMIFGSSNSSIDKVMDRFKAHFEIRVEPENENFLGFFVVDRGEAVKFYNQPMIRRLLEFCGMSDCKTVKTPLHSGLDLFGDESDIALNNVTPYRRLVGFLLNL